MLRVTLHRSYHTVPGLKLVDPDGGMLDQSWEARATALANAESVYCGQLDSRHMLTCVVAGTTRSHS